MKEYGCSNSRIALVISKKTGEIWENRDINNHFNRFDMNDHDINNYRPSEFIKEIFISKKKVALCCQTPEMKKMWEHFSDTLVMDSTFKMTESSWYFFTILGINSDGHSEVLCWFLTRDQ